ncbi:recombinase family protein [Spirillospora sp. NBC_00431]
MKWIFAQFIGGRGIFDIAEELTREGVPSPSAADPTRNQHRVQVAWSKSAVRVIITNPRYTGRQVWNKQRKDEVLLDVNDVALGHTTKLRWNDHDQWVWSEQEAHEPLVSVDDFERAQATLATRGRGPTTHKPHRTRRPYAFRGCLHCGYCERRMQFPAITGENRTMHPLRRGGRCCSCCRCWPDTSPLGGVLISRWTPAAMR